MKRLTMNQVARANLRHNRKAYFSLAIGIFLAVYLACTACLCILGTMEANDEQMARKMGWADTLLPHNTSITTNTLRRTELFAEIGHVYVTAAVNDQEVFLGRYDEIADKLLYRQCVEGRMPEKPGEIAAERSALDKLGLEEAAVGDVFTWQLKPFGVVKEYSEEREFTLVGILSEQSGYFVEMSLTNMQSYTNEFPSILTHPNEPDCKYGTRCVHWVMTNRPGVTLTDIQSYDKLSLHNSLRVSRVSGTVSSIDNAPYEVSQRLYQVILYLILGASLLLVTCVAIASAMESMLAQKTEDIGMMRAVGATKRQIRRLYGRDAWLLALTALPIGTALSCLTVWGFSLIAPAEMHFCPEPWLLIPVLAISLLCVFAASALPLRRASRQLPMGILRDTATLRKAKKFKQRKVFKGPQLIASRQFRLHPMRQFGSACMAGLMLLCALLLGEMLLAADWNSPSSTSAFVMDAGYNLSIRHEPFAQSKREDRGMTVNDINQLRTLPLISHTDTLTKTQALLLLPNELPDYLRSVELRIPENMAFTPDDTTYVSVTSAETFYLNMADTTTQDDFINQYYYNNALRDARLMRIAQQAIGVNQPVMPIDVYVVTLENADYSKYVTDGAIDLAALDAGREVLVYAPNMGYQMKPEGWVSRVDATSPQAEAVFINDYFRAGMTLPLMQLFGEKPDSIVYGSSDEEFLNYYSSLDKISGSPKVGAVLDGAVRLINIVPSNLCIITTPKGAAALGLQTNGVEKVNVYLSAMPNAEVEAMLESSISRIGMRRDIETTNHLAQQREERAYLLRMLVLFGGMVLLFFTVAVSMQVTNTSRHIRADERMVGTLRAVGADERALLSSYRLPTVMVSIVGFVMAAAVYLAMAIFYPIGFPQYHLWLLAAALVMAVLNALCAMMGVRGQLRRVMGKSIVENIREL